MLWKINGLRGAMVLAQSDILKNLFNKTNLTKNYV